MHYLNNNFNNKYILYLRNINDLDDVKTFDWTKIFNLSDYHKYDNHWNNFGNNKMCNYIKDIL